MVKCAVNATRFCHLNGSWDNYTDYTTCKDLNQMPEIEPGIEVATMIYSGGYALSLVALLIAVWIFLYFKDLRCLRNTIHTNLMCTYILADFMWILNITLQMSMPANMTACFILVVMLHYFHLTNFFWMFVEGLYLYMLVVETFSSKNIKLRAYIFIGWGVPFIVILIWSLVKTISPSSSDSQSQLSIYSGNCPWMTSHPHDWIYQGPAALILVSNFIFLIMIMWVLITKLRSANTVETQQYRKATKALLVLIPLLGITYILVLYGPTEGVSANIYAYLRAILLSTQGFTVALFYCFLNTEVQNTLRHRMERWKESRELGAGGRRYTYSKDWSPNTRTESIRLYSSHHILSHYKKRESTASETTTLTLIGTTTGTRVSNGSMAPGFMVRTSASPYLETSLDNVV
ncbi:diuretic hormone receptor-like [Nilaparvata lugens]|uniref:diuretic hormone receptor-like n=1 Tax=Nilaparvata lugens TaxID=108931 RepID=UPI00193EB8CD|nr:diuretic hormone receptor-like [Nilaparvata lugens]